MKLVVSGATGLVGTEVIRQSLLNPKITSIIALTRRPISIPSFPDQDVDTSKLKSLILEDFTEYTDDAKEQLVDVDACIWTLAITPTKSRFQQWDEVQRVNRDYTLAGLQAIAEARRSRNSSFRFLYMSGLTVPRDMSKKPMVHGDYLLLRGDVENKVLAFAQERKDAGWEACVAKPGLINRPGTMATPFISALGWVGGATVHVTECAAAMINQVLDGFENEPLTNADLVRLGQKELENAKKA